MPGLEIGRVAEVIVTPGSAGPGRRGSGYRVTADTVLTAAHVVRGASEIRVRFDADRPGQWSADITEVLEIPEADIALLTITPPGEAGVTPARFGRIGEHDTLLECSAVGFPLWKRRDSAAGPYRDTAHVTGYIPPLAGRREGTLEIMVTPPEQDPDPAKSPWQGMSGAAVFCRELIVGIVSRHHRSDGPGRLTASRADSWLQRAGPARQKELHLRSGVSRALVNLDDLTAEVVHWGAQVGAPPGPAPRQLPADTALFTGRDDELGRLLTLPGQAGSGNSPGTVVISAIDGMGGIGKTALAVRVAHRLAGRYPDGQLFIDLHGFTQGTAPRDPGDALVILLSSLGLPPGQIPGDLDARAALYRGRLAGTRTLILLDNAADEAQVRPLLPASDTCLVLITSRRRLKALDDALPVPLDVLALGEAVTLLRNAANLNEHPRDEVLLAQAAELCGRLPLALLIAGALLRTGGKAWNLPVLIGRLTTRQPGHELAGYTDETRSLEAVFDLSYRNLPKHQRLLFLRLGLLTGPEVDAYAAAALLEAHLDEVDRLLQHLADCSLLTGSAPGRYRLHDLIRAHARTRAAILDPELEREAAQDRLLHYYAHTAQAASLTIARLPRPAPDGPTPACTPDLSTPDAAYAWLRAEYPNLEAAHTHTSTHALEGHAIALAAGLAEILQNDGPFPHALEIHQVAADAAARRQQLTALATALTDLGRMRYQTGDHPGAADALAQSLKISRQTGYRLGEANALADLGHVRRQAGAYAGATGALVQALEIYRQLGDRRGEAMTLNYLGRARHAIGDYPGAADALAQALKISRQTGSRRCEAGALALLGEVRHAIGDYPGAADTLAQALEIYRQTGDRTDGAFALNRYAAAIASAGEHPRALALFQQALAMNRELNMPAEEAFSLEGVADHHLAVGDTAQGTEHLRQALRIYERLDMLPCVERVIARLAAQ